MPSEKRVRCEIIVELEHEKHEETGFQQKPSYMSVTVERSVVWASDLAIPPNMLQGAQAEALTMATAAVRGALLDE